MTAPDLHRVVRAWRAAGNLVALGDPADPAEIALAEEELGQQLPPELRQFFRTCNGMYLSGGDLQIQPLRGPYGEGLTTAAAQLREWDWPVPEELLVIGSNGGGEMFGVWAVLEAQRWPVVQMGSPTDEPDLAVVGTTLAGFLAAWTAYYLPLSGEDDPAVVCSLDELGVPRTLRGGDTEEHLWALLAWGSPDLPDPEPDPYARPVPPADLTRFAT